MQKPMRESKFCGVCGRLRHTWVEPGKRLLMEKPKRKSKFCGVCGGLRRAWVEPGKRRLMDKTQARIKIWWCVWRFEAFLR